MIGKQTQTEMDDELNKFKRIDLRQFAVSYGYHMDRKDKSCIRDADGDKLVVKRHADGKWSFWSVKDDRDHGTVIDFVSHRTGMNLGGIRRELRAWTGQPSPEPLPELPAKIFDRAAVQEAVGWMRDAPDHPYLRIERSIPDYVLGSWRWKHKIKIDDRRNSVFLHEDETGISGYEIRNTNFKGFSPQGQKSLWASKTSKADNRIVICESAVKALSFATLADDGITRYLSIGGCPSPSQKNLLAVHIGRMKEGSAIVWAGDADVTGRKLAAFVQAAAEMSGLPEFSFSAIEPPAPFKDWGDQWLAQRPQATTPDHSGQLRAG